MQREIKFRAWNPVENQIVKVLPDDFIMGKDGCIRHYYPKHILMQYTGLHDKNGKGIYEGDIFRCIYYRDGHADHKYVVEYGGAAAFRLKRTGKECPQDGVTQTMYDAERSEIVGNIYQNPELLTV